MRKPVFLSLLLALLLAAGLGQAGGLPFKDDYEGINRAAGSVLLLQVYSRAEEDYIASGSGFVAFDSRTLITNYHVVENGDLVMAESDSGQTFFLDQVLIADKDKDLAILRFKSEVPIDPLPLNAQGGWLRGQPVVAIGSPEGYKNSVSKGDISALFKEDGLDYIQFTAPISQGSSGGALFDNQGLVIGITASSAAGEGQNLNFAIDIREAIQLYAQAEPGKAYPLREMGRPGIQQGQAAHKEQPETAAVSVKGFTARQTRPDAVQLNWQGQLDKDSSFYIAYEIAGNSYYNWVDTKLSSYELTDLLPGQEYLFSIATSLEGLDRPLAFTSLQMDAPQPMQMRGSRLIHLGLYDLEKDQEPARPLAPGLASITQGSLEAALAGRELQLVYRLALEEAPAESKGSCLYALTMPTGSVYTVAYHYSFDAAAAAYTRRVDLQDLLLQVQTYEEALPVGSWQAAVYHDGALLGQLAFEVVPGAAADYPAAAPAVELPLAIGEEAYVGMHGQPYLDPDVHNVSEKIAVSSFTLAYYAEDAAYNTLSYGDSGKQLVFFTYDLEVGPGQTKSPGKVGLLGFGPGLHRVYVAVYQVRLTDGSLLTQPLHQLDFSSWEMD